MSSSNDVTISKPTRKDSTLKEVRVESSDSPGAEVGSTGKFRLAHNMMMLTYKGHINKEQLERYFTQKVLKSYPPEFFRCAHETSDKGYKHTHLLFKCANGKLFQSHSARVFDLKIGKEVLHPNIKVSKNGKHWLNQVRYLAKQDPDNADLRDARDSSSKGGARGGSGYDDDGTPPSISEIQEMKIEEAYARCGSLPSNYIALKAIQADTEYAREDEFVFDPEAFPWTKHLMKLVGTPISARDGDNRLIHWFYSDGDGGESDGGGVGKTTAGIYISEKVPSWLYLDEVCRGCDFARVILNCRRRGWDTRTKGVHGIIVDVPRMAENDIGLYPALEKICNGRITSTKYDSDIVKLRHYVHVVVLSNWPPKLVFPCKKSTKGYQQTLSMDRFRVWRIKGVDECEFVPVKRIFKEQIRVLQESDPDRVSYGNMEKECYKKL